MHNTISHQNYVISLCQWAHALHKISPPKQLYFNRLLLSYILCLILSFIVFFYVCCALTNAQCINYIQYTLTLTFLPSPFYIVIVSVVLRLSFYLYFFIFIQSSCVYVFFLSSSYIFQLVSGVNTIHFDCVSRWGRTSDAF